MALDALPQRMLIALVRGYRLLLQPWLGNRCRFEPTCSAYAIGALQRHGALAGSYLAAAPHRRGIPGAQQASTSVPIQPPRLFTRLISR